MMKLGPRGSKFISLVIELIFKTLVHLSLKLILLLLSNYVSEDRHSVGVLALDSTSSVVVSLIFFLLFPLVSKTNVSDGPSHHLIRG